MAVLIAAGSLNTEASVVNADGGFTNLSQSQIVAEMGAGWNLGNQLEASANGYPSETAYGNPVVTENLIKAVKAAGFKTVRIPVSWLNYIGSAPYYSIDYSWMTRVQQVVDYVVDNDMYAIIDLHNDGAHSIPGSWIQTESSDQDAIRTKLSAVWYQIAATFKDYDEHVIFESLNEVGVESANDIIRANQVINSYNQVFVDTVRVAGGNNDKRWLVVPGWITNIDYTADDDYGFTLPMDYNLSAQVPSGEKRIMVSAHYYTPWEFAGREDDIVTQWGAMADPGKSIFWSNEDYLNAQFYKLYDKFTSQGYPVILGEYGSVDKSAADSMNTDSRAYYANTLSEYAKIYGCVPIIWDNGFNGNYGFGLFNRQSASYPVTQPEIIGAIMYYYGNQSQSAISLNKTSMTLRLGNKPVTLTAALTPAASDWVEWSSSNPEVASVDRFGVVKVKTAGTTIITAANNGQSATSTVAVSPYIETEIYENNSGTGFSTSDTSWFTDAYDRDLITIEYTCTDAAKAGWNILGWGATVSGTWKNGPVYAASTTDPTGITSVTTTVGELKTALGISSGSDISFLQLGAYNSGQVRGIKLIQW